MEQAAMVPRGMDFEGFFSSPEKARERFALKIWYYGRSESELLNL